MCAWTFKNLDSCRAYLFRLIVLAVAVLSFFSQRIFRNDSYERICRVVKMKNPCRWQRDRHVNRVRDFSVKSSQRLKAASSRLESRARRKSSRILLHSPRPNDSIFVAGNLPSCRVPSESKGKENGSRSSCDRKGGKNEGEVVMREKERKRSHVVASAQGGVDVERERER